MCHIIHKIRLTKKNQRFLHGIFFVQATLHIIRRNAKLIPKFKNTNYPREFINSVYKNLPNCIRVQANMTFLETGNLQIEAADVSTTLSKSMPILLYCSNFP